MLDSQFSKTNRNSGGFRFPTARLILQKKFVTKFGTKKTKILILLRKSGSGGWDRTHDQIVKPDHKFKEVIVIKFSLLQQYILDLPQTAHLLN